MTPHILCLLENEGYPHDRKVRQQADSLVAAGYRVTVISPTGYGHDEPEEVMHGVRVIRYRLPPEGGGVVGYVREYGLSLARMARAARSLIRSDPPDIVMPCNPPDLLVPLARALTRGAAAIVFDHHDLSPELFERKFARRGALHRLLLTTERAAYRWSDVVLEPNTAYAEIAQARGRFPRERIFVVRHGADTDVFRPTPPDPRLRHRSRMILWMGNMTSIDRVAALLDAAAVLRARQRDDIGFTLLGSGEAAEEIRDEIRCRDLEPCFDLPGPVYGDKLRTYLATADVCVSVDVRNPMNDASTVTKVIDYMTMGRPVIQFPLREMSRLCAETTAYAKEGDAVDLADQIEALLNDSDRADRLGAAARERVLDVLAWDKQVPVLLDAIGAALALRQTPAPLASAR
ncbi:MAG: glycosyltransferase family 4 protein [Solirubrobacteraceae bacterium]